MLSNWTKATTTTTGTGTLTLAAISNFPLPSASRVTGTYVQYSINTSDNKFESGIGKLAATNTLERTKIFSTYNGTTYNDTSATALSLASGTHNVYITPMAESTFEAAPFVMAGPTNAVVYSTHFGGTAVNVGAAAVQRATAIPFRLETSGILTSMGIQVATTGTTSTTLLGLYEMESNGRPGRRIAKTSATIDTAGSTGWKTQTVDANARLTPGWYWVALCVTGGSGNPTFTGRASTTNCAAAMGGSGNTFVSMLRHDSAATDLADPFPATSLVYNLDSNVPMIGLILS